jgi:hypothetical protein
VLLWVVELLLRLGSCSGSLVVVVMGVRFQWVRCLLLLECALFRVALVIRVVVVVLRVCLLVVRLLGFLFFSILVNILDLWEIFRRAWRLDWIV